MKQKILIYLCMNALFSKTMQDTETQISQFIVEGSANSNMVSNCKQLSTIFGSCFIHN